MLAWLKNKISQLETSALLGIAEKYTLTADALLLKAQNISNKIIFEMHNKKRKGVGNAFWQFKVYQTGDDIRFINWKKSAKTEHLLLKETEIETANKIYFWADTSASMSYRSAPSYYNKAEYAAILSLSLLIALNHSEEQTALIGFNNQKSVKQQDYQLVADFLLHTAKDNAFADLLKSVHMLDSNSLLFVFSDLIYEPLQLEELCKLAMMKKIQIIFFNIYDNAEIVFPFKGRLNFNFLKENTQQIINNAKYIKDKYIANFNAHQQQMGKLCAKYQHHHILLNTKDEPYKTLITLTYQLQNIFNMRGK